MFLVLRGRGLEIVCFVVAAACCSQSHLCLAITSLKAVYARCSFCKPTIKCFFFNFYVIEGGITSCEYFVASFCHPITLPVVGACVLLDIFSLIFFDIFWYFVNNFCFVAYFCRPINLNSDPGVACWGLYPLVNETL